MIGFVAENLPRTGAAGLNLMGGAGMFAVSIYTIFMGGYYDRIIATQLPAGANPAVYGAAVPGSEMALAMEAARRDAGPEILNATLILPIILVAAFTGLVFYMRSRKKAETLTPINR
ncbi:MAG: hypothetical protein EOO00_06630 [Chitinophagaceae bacterium]|nr:MAG: hypothetical protein EOO00_06630 [Chitinophagaceae bacterium]